MQSLGERRKVEAAGRKGAAKTIDIVRQLIDKHAQLPVAAETLAADADLYRAGLTPFAAIRTMLALEEAYCVEFPARMLRRQSLASINSIVACLEELQQSCSKAA